MNFSGLSNKSLVGRALRAPTRLIPKSLVVPILQGPTRGRRWVVGSTNHGAWLGSYEQEKQRSIAKAIKPGAVVYDVGANVGVYTLLAAGLVGPSGLVVAFEPVPGNLQFLRRHIALNHLSNVEVVPAAVADAVGTARFSSSVASSLGRLDDAGAIEVAEVTIDSYVERSAARPPTVLKIDVEGAELSVLHGARTTLHRNRPTIFLATHSPELRATCTDLLAKIGYRVEIFSDDPDELVASPE